MEQKREDLSKNIFAQANIIAQGRVRLLAHATGAAGLAVGNLYDRVFYAPAAQTLALCALLQVQSLRLWAQKLR